MCFSSLSAQEKTYSGRLLIDKSDSPVPFGAIKNLSTGNVSITDDKGLFSIEGVVGDTLKFHSLGYEDREWIIPGIWNKMSDEIVLNVNTAIYSLQEVEVVRYYSYAHFKQAFKDLRVPKTEAELAKEMVSSWNFKDEIAWGQAEKKYNAGNFGVSIGFNVNPVAKQRKEIQRLEKKYDDEYKLNTFRSRDNISYLTGYKGTCLDSFMVYLNSTCILDYKMKEFELLTIIDGAQKKFVEKYENSDWFICDSIQTQ